MLMASFYLPTLAITGCFEGRIKDIEKGQKGRSKLQTFIIP
jgi:hypothetical protein